MSEQIENEALLLDEEVLSWTRVPPSSYSKDEETGIVTQDLIDPRLIAWLHERNFDLNRPISTRRIPELEGSLYTQERAVEKRIMIPGCAPRTRIH